MTTPTISCIIPTRDRPEELRRALSGVLVQTLPPAEIVVVDDDVPPSVDLGSLTALAREHGFRGEVSVEHSGGRGASAARNLGAHRARGELLAFLDDDDEWDSRYLEEVAAATTSGPAAVFVTWSSLVGDRRGSQRGTRIRPGLGYVDCVATNPGVFGSNLVVTKDAVSHIGGFDEDLKVSNDKDFFARLLRAGFAYAVVPKRLVRYHHHASKRLTTTSNPARRQSLIRYLEKHGPHIPAGPRRRLALSIAREEAASLGGWARVGALARVFALGIRVGPKAVQQALWARALRRWVTS
jgi:glycosyltransferase involved in cell wall biosynthesis